jgi:hypothetical protein
MPRYLVESHAAGSLVKDRRERPAGRRPRGRGVGYLRTTFVPLDETVLHVFEAPSAPALARAGRRAELRFERIVEAVDSPADYQKEDAT